MGTLKRIKVDQPSKAPTRKLNASLVGLVLGAVFFEVAATFWPALHDVEISGVGTLSIAVQLITAGVLGYVIKDRQN